MGPASDTAENGGAARLVLLGRLSRLLESVVSIDDFAVALADYCQQAFGATAVALVLVDPQTGEQVHHCAGGLPPTLLQPVRTAAGEGFAGWICRHRQPLNVADARQDERFMPRVDQTTGFYTRSVMGVPMHREGQVDGALLVMNRADGQPFEPNDLAMLGVVAEQLGLLVANTVLISDLRRRNAHLTTLIAIDRAVNSVHDLNALLTTILQSAADVAKAAGSSVVLQDAESGELTFFHAVGPAKDQLAGVRIEAGRGIVGHCIATGESVYVPDAYEDPRFFRDVDMQTGFRTTSLLAVPLKTDHSVTGALEVVNLEDVGDIAQLILLMEAFASQAAVALERAQLYRRLERRVATVNKQLLAANASLANEQATRHAMIQHMADAVIMIDNEGRLLVLNDAARRLFGLGEEPVLGLPALDVQNVSLGAVLAVGETGPDGTEVSIQEPEQRTLRVHAAEVESSRGRIGKVVVCADITQLRELAEMRTELISFVSHELRTPLTSIKGFAAALLADDRLKEDDHRNFVRIIDHECDRLRRMVADLLCMARLDSGRALDVRWQHLDLVAAIERVLEAQRVYAPGHQLVLDSQAAKVLLEADADKIEQVLTNLVNNAIKYSAHDSTVTVRLTETADAVQLAVCDQGYGIAAADLPHLFQQYSRVGEAERRRIRGAGLGLYLTKALVEAHGGRIGVASELGHGSTFTVDLPKRRTWSDA